VCNGRAWVFVTSQADLEGVLGAFRGMEAQDISKILARFKTEGLSRNNITVYQEFLGRIS
jgi:hypothetical protein